MKPHLSLIFLLFAINFCRAQNLVSNGNFEQYSPCPTVFTNIVNATGWSEFSPTPDYFNACASSVSGLSVPTNNFGTQSAASGNGYAGIIVGVGANTAREGIGRPITPMIPGATYEVSMSVSLGEVSWFGVNSLGVYFFDNGPSLVTPAVAATKVPQVSYSSYGPISNQTNWVRLTKNFIADSAYDNIAISGFGPNSSFIVDTVNTSGAMFAYYYIDSVVVKLAGGINNLYAGNMICTGDTFQVPYTLVGNTIYNTGNVFSVQLSNNTGSFASGTTILGTRTATTAGSIVCVVPNTVTSGNSYRLRIISNNAIDSSVANLNNITISNYPIKPVASPDSVKCANGRIYLTANTSTTGVTYSWVGPSGYTSVLQNPVINNITSAMTGSYIVTASLNGCATKDTTVVTVNPSPLSVIASANTPVCQNDTVKLYSTNSSSGVNWHWSGPGGFVSSSKDTLYSNVQPSQSGYYVVSATNNFNCKSTDSVYVLIKPAPANVNATTNAPICAGATLFLTSSTSSSGVSFSWTGPNGFSSTLQNPNISSATTVHTGNYILAVTLNGCSISDTVYSLIKALPVTPTASANTPVCVGQDLQLGASTVPGASYSWTSTTGYSASVQNPLRSSATTAFAGKYYVTATANGCVSPADSVTVTVNPAPTINMYPSPKDSICVGQTVTFVSSNSNAGSSYIRSWFRNNTVIGGAANANYSTATAADGDEYFATLTAYGVCATPYTDTSNMVKMHVLPYLAPAVSITANPNATVKSGAMINFTATPTNGGAKPAYQWTRNGAPVVGATSNIWGASTLSNNDQICVDMTSSYLCPNPKSAKSNCIKVSIESTGIAGVWSGKEPSIYPNPAKEKLIIEGIEKGTKIQLVDVVGRKVLEGISTESITELNMNHLVPGNYVLILSTTEAGDRMTVKVVKE